MRALIVAGETRSLGELGETLTAQGYELTHIAADDPALPDAARESPMVVIDLRAGVAMAELACARLAELGDPAPFSVLYGEVPALRAAEHLLDGKARAFLVPEAPLNHLRLRAFAGTIKIRSRAAAALRDLQRASTQSREHEEALRGLLERVNDGVLIHRGGTMLFMNTRWAELVGAPDRFSAVGKSILDRVSPENRELIAPRLLMAESGTPMPARELHFQRPDGTQVTALVHTFPTIFEREPALLTYARDVTAQRALEAKLIAANRMVALGRLAANVGHEINNPLAFLVGNAEHALSLATSGGNTEALVASIKNVLDGATRVQNIVRDLKDLSRPSGEETAPTQIAKVLESCLRIAESTIAPRARVKMNLHAHANAQCNEARLGQVFLNLLMNAAEAIPPGDPEHHTISVSTEDRPPHIVVTIGDTGVGIPAEHLGSIFEPFFTTKADGRGTGLGLSISHALVTAQGGRIEAESKAGAGTRMIVHLPMAAPAEQEAAKKEVSPGANTTNPATAQGHGAAVSEPRKRHRILVVDDEVQLGRLIQGFLTDYDVVLATSGASGLEELDGGTPFDLVLCDLMMPDVTGMDIYDRVSRTKPDMCGRFVFMTGGAFTPAAATFLDMVAAKGNACVEKPFRIDALVATIAAKLLDQ